MARAKREDERLLSKDEQHLVAQTRHPIVKKLKGHDLLKWSSNCASVATGRAKSAGTNGASCAAKPRHLGMTVTSGAAASESEGHRAKRTLLSGALKRANKEIERRRVTDARSDLISNAKRALAMKKAADTDPQWPPATRTANEGMQANPNTDTAPSGALKQEGQRPVLERSRKVR
jgi:hypothetical protein